MTWKYLPSELPKPGKFVNIAYLGHDEVSVDVIGGHVAKYGSDTHWLSDTAGSPGCCPLLTERVIAWHDAPTWPPK